MCFFKCKAQTTVVKVLSKIIFMGLDLFGIRKQKKPAGTRLKFTSFRRRLATVFGKFSPLT
jgi:hypothetical protein